MLPFNVELMKLDREKIKKLKPILTLDIYDGGTNNFHEDGLFSVSIFGRVGSDERDIMFSYIDIKAPVLHPVIYFRLCRLKSLYKGIMSGKSYAVWDDEEKDFLPSDAMNGDTGYSFFMSHWEDIKFKETKSTERKQRIELIEKNKDRALVDKVLVIPAGLRDLQVDDNGRQIEDEINSSYRRVLSIANTIGVSRENARSPVLDNARHSLQMVFNEIYSTLENLLTGKKGFIQKKWGSRRIFNGTRNVISSMDTSVKELGQSNSPKFNDAVVGLYQTIKAALPLTKNLLLNGYLSEVFGRVDSKVILVDRKTLQPEYVDVDPETHDRWSTPEGIEKVINSYNDKSIRNKPVEIEGRYLGLIYTGPNGDFRIFNNIDDLPEDFSREDVHPLTLCQLIYLSGYRSWNTLRGFVSRYPITGTESIYPTQLYVKTTVVSEMRWELGPDWERIGGDYVALEFPKQGSDAHIDSLTPHSSRLAGLGADFDGDTCSLDVCYSDEAVEEINSMLNKRQAYLDPRGGFKASTNVNTVALVLRNMTGDY